MNSSLGVISPLTALGLAALTVTPPKPGNHRSQATVRRAVRRRSNLPKAIQKRLGFKCR